MYRHFLWFRRQFIRFCTTALRI